MFYKLILLFCCLTPSIIADEYNKVPVISWNIKGSPLQMHSVSAFETEVKESTLKDVLEEKPLGDSVAIVAFIVDKLSMEDLASANGKDKDTNLKKLEAFLDKQPHILYPSVNEPVKHIRQSNCGIHNIHVADEKESVLQKSIAKAVESSCVVLVHLPGERILGSDFYLPSVKGNRKDVIGLFTGRRSSWVMEEPKKRQARSLLAVDTPENDHFINVTGCIFMYVENVTLQIGGSDNETRSLSFPPQVDGTCSKGNSSEEASLELTFSGEEDISKVVIKMTFVQKYGSWLLANGSSLSVDGGPLPGEWILDSRSIEAPLGFSYSCGSLRLRPLKRDVAVVLIMTRFQIQPYGVNGKFAESFDCVPFFTLPIWMGIFVGLLLIAILNTGIYALFSIKTMDRFDDPKGRTISVPT